MRLLILAAAVLLLLLQVLAAGAARTGAPLLKGWQPITNLNNPYVREIARFTVKTHNGEANTRLLLKKVVRGETQVVAGTNYRLVVEVKDGSDAKRFEALFWDKPWEHVQRLSSFKAVQGDN